MKIPKGYTESQILKVIEKVCKRLSTKYTFGIYDADDIKQEAFIMAIEGLEKYEEQAPIEAFLYQHTKHKLKNLKRKKFSRASFNCNNCEKFDPKCSSCLKREKTELSKRNLSNPIDIHAMDPTKESNMVIADCSDEVDMIEINRLINKNLPIDMREDYLKIKDGTYVEKSRKSLIEATITEIIKDYL